MINIVQKIVYNNKKRLNFKNFKKLLKSFNKNFVNNDSEKFRFNVFDINFFDFNYEKKSVVIFESLIHIEKKYLFSKCLYVY